MEKNKRGGKRLGAGRKPIADKKKLVPLYVGEKKIWSFGNEQKLKDQLYSFIDGKIIPVPPVPTDDKPLKFEKPKIAIKRTPAHWVELRRDCQNADDYAKWLEDLENDKFLTPREVREIKATV